MSKRIPSVEHSLNDLLAHVDPHAALEAREEFARTMTLAENLGYAAAFGRGAKTSAAETKPGSEGVSSRQSNRSRSDLEKNRYERITVRQMNDWDIGTDDLDKMAARAAMDDRIHDDYVFKRREKNKHLWARLKDG